MADTIHRSLSAFRDTMLTAVARLEFELRDAVAASAAKTVYDIPIKSEVQDVTVSNTLAKFEKTLQDITGRMHELEVKVSATSTPLSVQSPTLDSKVVQELMAIQLPEHSRNLLVPSIRSTPALAAAVAAANVPGLMLTEEESEVEEVVVEESEEEIVIEEEEEGEVVEESEEVDDDDSSEPLKKVVIKGQTYYMDEDNAVYHETEDGYEQVGTYNPKTDSVEVIADEAEEAEEEEEAVEVEEFVFKGKTYQRDSDNNVYLDGDHIGTWNGKKIVALA